MTSTGLQIDAARGAAAGALLHHCFATTGIHGNTEMPEDALPAGMARGSLEHLLFITLSVSIDYQRDANVLWAASRTAFEDADTRWVFYPAAIHEKPSSQLVKDLQRHGVSKKPDKDAWIWRTVALSFFKKWGGDPRNFLADCSWDAITILQRLKDDAHIQVDRTVKDYPYLSGDKIGPLWLRMLRDNVGENRLRRLDRVPIPVDVHVARATLALGIVRGSYAGPLAPAFDRIREAWFEAVKSWPSLDGRPMIALDVDEPLWHLSKLGCTYRDQQSGTCRIIGSCPGREYCVGGKVIVRSNFLEVQT